jgi:hypothetical protein
MKWKGGEAREREERGREGERGKEREGSDEGAQCRGAAG